MFLPTVSFQIIPQICCFFNHSLTLIKWALLVSNILQLSWAGQLRILKKNNTWNICVECKEHIKFMPSHKRSLLWSQIKMTEGRFVAVSYFEFLQNTWKSIFMAWRIMLKCFYKTWDGEARTGSSWPNVGTGGGLL